MGRGGNNAACLGGPAEFACIHVIVAALLPFPVHLAAAPAEKGCLASDGRVRVSCLWGFSGLALGGGVVPSARCEYIVPALSGRGRGMASGMPSNLPLQLDPWLAMLAMMSAPSLIDTLSDALDGMVSGGQHRRNGNVAECVLRCPCLPTRGALALRYLILGVVVKVGCVLFRGGNLLPAALTLHALTARCVWRGGLCLIALGEEACYCLVGLCERFR